MKKYTSLLFFIPFGLITLLVNVTPRFAMQALLPEAAPVQIRITSVGDLMCHSDEFIYARLEKDSFDFAPYFTFVRPCFRDADIMVGNLETVLAGANKNYTGYPFFNSPDDYAYSLKNLGFNLLSLANNHCLDRGAYGIERTLEVVSNAGINSMGTAASAAGRDSLRIYTHKGLKVGFLCYTYGTNGNPIPKGREYMVNVIDTMKIQLEIKRCRPLCDLLVTFFHFGKEYETVPNDEQKKIAELCARNGVDLLIGSHPHVLQPIEILPAEGSVTGTMVCAYSLGNFLSNQRWRYSDAGAVFSCTFEKDTVKNSWRPPIVSATPTWVYKGAIDGKKTYRILIPTSDTLAYSFLPPGEKAKMQQAFEDTRSKLTQFQKTIHVR